MKTNEKKETLARFFELLTLCGYSITDYMGKPLSYYNFEGLTAAIDKLEEELNQQND
jgi:hypothetical protein